VDPLTVAKILFAETGTLRPDAAAPTALDDARQALATAVAQANGVGFAPASEPTAITLASDDNRRAWNASLAAANQPTTTIVGNVCVFDDQALTTAASLAKSGTIGDAKSWRLAFGPFQDPTGKLLYLNTYDAPPGATAGRYPRDDQHPVTAGTTGQSIAGVASKLRHGGTLGIALVVFVAVIALVGYWAYHDGTRMLDAEQAQMSAWVQADHQSEFDIRLTKAVKNSVTSDALATEVVNQVETALALAAGSKSPAVAPTQPYDAASTAAEAKIAKDAAEAAVMKSTNVVAAQRGKTAVDAALAVEQAIEADPLFKAVGQADLIAPWIFAAVTIAVVIALTGSMIRQSILGAMIDNRNRLSLSLMQMAGWSVLVFSLFYVTSLFLIGVAGSKATLPVYNPGIWALLGLSIGSAATSRIILAGKDLPPATQAGPATTGSSASTPAPTSQLDKRDDPNAWSLFDLFMGEEVNNASTVDLSRLQQVIITVVLMIIFCSMTAHILGSIVWQTDDWESWATTGAAPNLWGSQTFLGLLAISHGGYLLFKGLPKTSPSPPTGS